MTEELLEPTATRAMTEEEAALAADFYTSVQDWSNNTARTRQALDAVAGISDLGFCSERLRRTMTKQVPTDTDSLAAFAGTWLGEGIEQAYKAKHPEALLQQEVSVRLVGERYAYNVPGHVDIIDPAGIVIDAKTDRGLGIVERTGPSQQQQFQRHLYGVGAFNGGLFHPDVKIEDVKVANVWMDRACDDKRFHVHMEPLSLDLVEEAARWLDEVVYAFENDQEARKEPPREVCQVTCGFFKVCRAYDTDVEGLLTDDSVLAAVSMYDEGRDLEKEGKRLKDQAKAALDGVSGSTGEFTVRWVWVNEGMVPSFRRNGYNRLDLRRIK